MSAEAGENPEIDRDPDLEAEEETTGEEDRKWI
jgi:hypothetical protein